MSALDAYAQPVDRTQQIGVDASNLASGDEDQQRQSRAATLNLQLNALQQKQTEAAKAKAATTAAGDFTQWALNPPTAGVPFHKLDQYSQARLASSYPELGSGVASQFNQVQRDVTGNPDVGAELQPGELASNETGGEKVQRGKPVPDLGMRSLRTKAAQMGINDLPPDATQEEVQDRIATAAQGQQQIKQSKDDAAQQAKANTQIARTMRMVQTNPQVRNYNAARANFDSIQSNVAKPVRTGADDAFLLQAAATMEAPGRSPTANDVKEFMRANGITGNLDTLADRWGALINSSPEAQQRAGRILSDQLAQQIAAAAKNSLTTRRSSLTETIAPHVYQLEDNGADPYRVLPKELVDDVYGASEQSQAGAQPTAKTTPAAQAPNQTPTLTTKAQFDALPSGAEYFKAGQRYRKP